MEDIDYNGLFGVAAEADQETNAETDPETDQEADTETDAEDMDEPAAEDDEGAEDAAPEREPEAEAPPEQASKPAAPPAAPTGPKPAVDTQRLIDDAFRNSGLVNPYTNEPITTKVQYDAYRQRFEAERKAEILTKSGMTEDEFDRFVGELPEVREARQRAEQAEREMEAARAEQAQRRIDAQVKEIAALDASVQTLADLTKMDNYDQFYAFVQKGNSLVDAYRLANFERLTQSAAAQAAQAAANTSRSKGHLKGTAARGTGSISVPASVKEEYRLFNPDATDAEIERHYKKYAT